MTTIGIIGARATPRGMPDRRALAVAGDDPAAKEATASYIDDLGFDDLGFDVVDLGPLAEGWRV